MVKRVYRVGPNSRLSNSFEADISGILKDVCEDVANKVIRKTALAALTSVVERSPVDTGRFRSNWKVGVNEINGEASDSTENTAVMHESPKLKNVKVGDAVNISNNVPYAQMLEYGHSKQAPEGVVEIVADSLPAVAQKIADREMKGAGE